MNTSVLHTLYVEGTKDNVPLHQEHMLKTRDELYSQIQMRTCDVCCERRWWRNPNKNQPSVPQRYIEPLDESHMYPNADDMIQLQKEFDQLNAYYGREPYDLCERTMEAAHRVKLTAGVEYKCSL